MDQKDKLINADWFKQQIIKHKTVLLFANLIAILATVVSVPIPLIMPILVDEVLLNQPGQGLTFISGLIPTAWQSPSGFIWFTLFLVIGMRALGQALTIYQNRQFTLVSKQMTYQIRAKLLDKLPRISMQAYELKGSGGINAHLTTDIETIDQFLGSTLSKFIVGLFSLIGTNVVLLLLNWRLGLFIILVNPLVIYFSKRLSGMVQHLKKQENTALEQFQNRLVETLDGIYQLRTSNKERAFLAQLKTQANDVRIAADKFAWQSEAAGRVSFLLFLIGFELFRAVAMLMLLFSDLSIGEIFAVFGYLWFMLTPVQDLLGIQLAWYGAKAAITRVNDLLSTEEEEITLSKVDPFCHQHSIEVSIENLFFSYDKEKLVLNNMSLHLPKGKKVALVGVSGGGKSTLIQLLLGVYRPSSGVIKFNGENAQDIGFELIREHVSVVLQHPILFNDTLRQNLTLGSSYPDEKLWQALNIAQLDDLITELNQGLETPIGKSGVRLSGGQRQRLAIARMILTDPKLVILDEATSALDTLTEASLHKALTQFLQDRTTLIVAHRLSAVRQADLIYVLEDGKVAQAGTHHQLINEYGLYQTLYGQPTEKTACPV